MTTGQIRETIVAGDYSQAAKMFEELVRTVPLTEESLREAAELVEWARLTTLCARAHLEARLQAMRAGTHVLTAYGG
jgi:hypothetical protein